MAADQEQAPAEPEALVVAGDPSGDLHGSSLIAALKAAAPGLRLAAIGGARMRGVSDRFIFDLAAMGVSGFLEPVRRLPVLYTLDRDIKRYLRERRPVAVVCVDFYGFNRWVLEAARSEGAATYYYVSPQVWASRPGRVRLIKRLVDRMLVIFPFEERIYREAGVPVSFVGHPLLDHRAFAAAGPERGHARTRPPDGAWGAPGRGGLRLGLLPGSRAGEVHRHLPIMLEALARIRAGLAGLDVSACVFSVPHLPREAYARAAAAGVEVAEDADYARRSRLDFAITSSGTATLENALLGVPMVVIYRMTWPTYAFARCLVRVRHIAMANILAGREVVPELIQHHATPERVARAALSFLRDRARMAAARAALLGVRRTLGGPGASQRAARAILDDLRGRRADVPGARAAAAEGA